MATSAAWNGNEAEDRFVKVVERWEKRVIAVFLLLAKIIGLTALLIIELAMAWKIWQNEMHTRAESPPELRVHCGCATNQER